MTAAAPVGGPLRARRRVTVALLAGVAVVLSVGVWASRASSPGGDPGAHTHPGADGVLGTPTRHVGPQGRVGQFVVRCTYSHSAPDDPIVHPGHPGRSHRHDFFGATGTDAHATAAELARQPTTCDKAADTAAYWQPTLYDHGREVEPVALHAYYRAAPGVDPTRVVPPPFGLELIAGDPTASTPTGSEAAGWVCGTSTRLSTEPPTCSPNAPLHLVLTFPDCWDGERLRSADHRAHAAYSTDGVCPDSHPVHLPQLTVSVAFPISGPGHDLTLASGSVHSAHGDFLNAWDDDGLRREVERCIHRGVVCDLASNREEEAPFFHG